MKKIISSILLAGVLLVCLSSCDWGRATITALCEAVAPTSAASGADDQAAVTTAPASEAAESSAAADETETAAAGASEATAAPESTPSLRAGTYEGEDGSVLTVNEDGSCTYKTEISGTINGQAMTGSVTFHGTVEDGTFTFTRITYMGMDITSMAAAAGYSDASYWEAAAASLYG
ncbi:MAG: hypothetical protein LUE21_09925 [Oscillospiraceae bacterium]|nr:hypothetical protein [Oscillospiraceae bacterium]